MLIVDGGALAKRCNKCEVVKPLDAFRKSKDGIAGHIAVCLSCDREIRRSNRERYAESKRLGVIRRRARKKLLPSSLTRDQMTLIVDFSQRKCVLTGSSDVEIDHFIPLSWGHGGTFYGNLYLLDSSLNSSKQDKNPLTWYMDEFADRPDIASRWLSLLQWLADLNGLSLSELVSYVFWCDANRRNVDKIIRDSPHTSLEIWKSHFSPYPFHRRPYVSPSGT